MHDIPGLVAKELVDNALDAGGDCRLHHDRSQGHLVVRDSGPGIDGDDATIAELFSITRPLMSSKLLRRPTRGALGNGLRIVAGAVLASGGRLVVSTRGRSLRLTPDYETGRTTAERIDHDRDGWNGASTDIRVQLGEPWAAAGRAEFGRWVRLTLAAARAGGPVCKRRSSPYWYNSEAFFGLLQAWTGTVRDLILKLDGCNGANAGRIAADFKNRRARDLDRRDADQLLAAARRAAKPVKGDQLGHIGRTVNGFPAGGYHRVRGYLAIEPTRGEHDAEIPAVVEVWAEVANKSSFDVLVNRTQVPMQAWAEHNQKDRTQTLAANGQGLTIPEVGIRPHRVVLNIDTPYMPILDEAKKPALFRFSHLIHEAADLAMKRAKRTGSRGRRTKTTLKAAVLRRLHEGIARASGDGQLPFNQRQPFYPIRKWVAEDADLELRWPRFTAIVTAYEAEHGRIPRMTRDPRGTLYHPHRRQAIALGTAAVDGYRRPQWTFNKILYIEKETYLIQLVDAGWPERNDCALVCTKGQPTRAVRDLFDLLGETDEPLTFFCVHDADAPGTIIYQSLWRETQARPSRTVKVVDLGLQPREGLEMGLEVEEYDQRGKIACADDVPPEWRTWFGVGTKQGKRIELNAMTAPQLFAWLDRKMAEHVGTADGPTAKVVPPRAVQAEQFDAGIRAKLRADITERVLAEAGIDDRVEAAMRARTERIATEKPRLPELIREGLEANPQRLWSAIVDDAAEDIARAGP